MSITQVINGKLECNFKEIEKHLDSSFDNIKNFIDQMLILDSPNYKLSNSKSELSQPIVNEFNLIGQSEFQSKIIQELAPLINSKIKNHVQIKLQSEQQNQFSLTHSQLSALKQEIQYQSQSSLNLKPFNYQIIQDYSIKQQEWCSALAFNKDCSIVASGCKNIIKIYEFKQGLMKQIQVLNDHKKDVTTLNFMKKSNQFISGDEGGSILIWSNNNNNQWNCSQNIQGHKDWIKCLIMNKKEDLFISSSDDKTIKFWIKSKEWICQQTITNHTQFVFQLSLNEQQNQVISCGRDQLILIIEYSEESKKWIVVQNIKVDCWGSRLCFINDNLFTFQPKKGNLMYVYEMNSGSKQFTKIKDITIKKGDDGYPLFPQQYIKSKQLLVSKHYNYINLIRKTENDEFKVQQSIQFGEKMLYGQMSDDGEYLITWDTSSEEIQIRRCKEE